MIFYSTHPYLHYVDLCLMKFTVTFLNRQPSRPFFYSENGLFFLTVKIFSFFPTDESENCELSNI